MSAETRNEPKKEEDAQLSPSSFHAGAGYLSIDGFRQLRQLPEKRTDYILEFLRLIDEAGVHCPPPSDLLPPGVSATSGKTPGKACSVWISSKSVSAMASAEPGAHRVPPTNAS